MPTGLRKRTPIHRSPDIRALSFEDSLKVSVVPKDILSQMHGPEARSSKACLED